MAVLVQPANKPRWVITAVKLWGDGTSVLSGAPDKTAKLCRLAFTIQSKRISCSLVFWTCFFPILSPSFHPFPQFNMKLQIFTVIMLLKIFLAVCQVVCFQVGQAQGFRATEILASRPAYLPFHKKHNNNFIRNQNLRHKASQPGLVTVLAHLIYGCHYCKHFPRNCGHIG